MSHLNCPFTSMFTPATAGEKCSVTTKMLKETRAAAQRSPTRGAQPKARGALQSAVTGRTEDSELTSGT